MSQPLPRLRQILDVFPSPVEDQPGLLLRDPFRYSEDILIIPPIFVSALQMLDGRSTDSDLQQHLSELIGRPFPIHPIHELIEALQQSGFLEGEEFELMRADKHAAFAAAPFRDPAHAGSAYPDQESMLRQQLDERLWTIVPPRTEPVIGIAAPHVSPEGGWDCYAAAYNRLRGISAQLRDKTIVILGTSHYGEPEKFGLTRKPFRTPYGVVQTDTELVDWLTARAPDAVTTEDFCHTVEHSIEFQVIFLQHLLGQDFRILPVLCGAFFKSFVRGKLPESDDRLRRFFDTLGEMAELHRDRLFWVLGVDLAHIGRRYGDPIEAAAQSGYMLEVRAADEQRLSHVCRNESAAFMELVLPDRDPLKWCGLTPIYTFMQAVRGAQGTVLKYDQWNIDNESVVTFAALEFASR